MLRGARPGLDEAHDMTRRPERSVAVVAGSVPSLRVIRPLDEGLNLLRCSLGCFGSAVTSVAGDSLPVHRGWRLYG